MADTTTTYRSCTLCEATCGLEVVTQGARVVRLQGDRDDPFSRGYICPKAYGLKALHDDPDRLRQPQKRTAAGWQTISWQEAFHCAIEGLSAVRSSHGPDAVGTYLGNPSVHSLHALLYGPVLQRALGTKQRYSASSADQLPKMVSSAWMFGGGLTIPVPDIDRTDFLMVLGANPVVSNGSLMTAPNVPQRLKAIRQRGGRIVVFDPRRTETAALADDHFFIRPGTDALLLLSMVHVMFRDGLVKPGAAGPHLSGTETVEKAVTPFAPARVAGACGIDAFAIEKVIRDFCRAPSAVCYGRIGTTCQQFGTVASWAVDVVNALSGNLDRPGGAMFTQPAANRAQLRPAGPGSRAKFGRWHSRVQRLPEAFGELPVATLSDEILTEGPGAIRAMVTLAGNPVLSAPHGSALEQALGSLDFMVAVDFYLNETTRFADIVLPPPSPLQRDSYELALYHFGIRNIAKYTPPALPRDPEHPDEWVILLTLAKGLMGMGSVDINTADAFILREVVTQELVPDRERWLDLDLDEVLGTLGDTPGPARLLDLFLRLGPYGDGFGRVPEGLTLGRLQEHPHGLDLGPLSPRLPEILRTPTGRVELAPEAILDVLADVERACDADSASMVLVGRRHLRSNNSWMHNLLPLVKGPERCILLIHPTDAHRLGLKSGQHVRIGSRVGQLEAPVLVSDEMMPGVVSLPHGWGHTAPGAALQVAAAHPGVNANVLSDNRWVDGITGNAAFNGVPVTLEPLDG